jgi:hypothetical protein
LRGNWLTRQLAKRPWSKRRLDQLAGETLTTLTKLTGRFTGHYYRFKSGGEIAWGQYLDDAHYSKEQWGFYGTSSAIQTFAIRARQLGRRPSEDSDIRRAVALPRDHTTTDPRFKSKRRPPQKDDFENIIKLAFIADALDVDNEHNVPAISTAPLIRELMRRAIDHQRWCTRPSSDPDYGDKDLDFPSALIVSVLRRYEAFRACTKLSKASRQWLAERVTDASFREQTTLLALTGLALLPHPDDVPEDSAKIKDALKECERHLINWVHGPGAGIVLNRPVFNGFSLGARNDYIFLHPELLIALFFIKRNSPPRGRRFVLDVVDGVVRNVDRHSGFMGQDGYVTSVDQLWTARLIHDFRNTYKSPGGPDRLLPRPDVWLLPHSLKSALGWIVVVLMSALALMFWVEKWVGVAVIAAEALLVMFGHFLSRFAGRDDRG